MVYTKKQKQSSRARMAFKKRPSWDTRSVPMDTFSLAPQTVNFFNAMVGMLFLTNYKKHLRDN